MRVRNDRIDEKYVSVGQFWSDGQRFEVKQNRENESDSFPMDVASTGNLNTTFEKTHIYWFDPDATIRSRFWQGINGGEKSARIGGGGPERFLNSFVFPPLAFASDRLMQKTQWHLIDDFFALPKPGFQVVRYDNAMVYLRHDTRKDFPTRLKGDFKSVIRIESETDVSRGFLPIRMTWKSFLERDGKTFISDTGPFRELRVSRIQKINGGFYPLTGEVRTFFSDPATPAMTIEEYAAGKRVEDKLLLHDKLFWEAKVEDRVDLAPEFEIKFPEGTLLYDETGKRIQGMVEVRSPKTLPP